MTFSEPYRLLALFALPVVVLLHALALRRGEQRLRLLAGGRTPNPLLAERRPGTGRLGAALQVLALGLLIVGSAGPEWGRELTRRRGTGSDVLFVLDCSASMDARDVSPSRLAEARREALSLLERLEGSRVGAVAFSGDAVRLAPLTQDLSAVRLSLEFISSQTVSEPGTDLGRALRMAMKVLPKGRREEQVVILWTDGEDLEAGGRKAIDEIAATGIRVFAVGVGTPSGDVVPVLDEQGRVTDIKRDENGTAVRSRLDEGLLRGLARRSHGGYFAASRPGGELPRLIAALSGVERSSRASRLIERRVARFPLFALGAALLIGVALGRPRRRILAEPLPESGRRLPSRERRPARSRAPTRAAVAAALLALLWGGGAAAQTDWARGDGAFRQGRYARAESLYTRRARSGSPPALQVNRATARALSGDREAAANELSRLTAAPGRPGREARYNLGTVLGERREYDAALAKLREALERDPGDEDARWNYEVLLRQRRRQQQQDKNPKNAPQGQPPPEPSPSQQNPSQPPPASGTPPPPSESGAPKPAPGSAGEQGLSREQAQQLLGSLEELARSDQQRQQKVRVLRDRRGRDW